MDIAASVFEAWSSTEWGISVHTTGRSFFFCVYLIVCHSYSSGERSKDLCSPLPSSRAMFVCFLFLNFPRCFLLKSEHGVVVRSAVLVVGEDDSVHRSVVFEVDSNPCVLLCRCLEVFLLRSGFPSKLTDRYSSYGFLLGCPNTALDAFVHPGRLEKERVCECGCVGVWVYACVSVAGFTGEGVSCRASFVLVLVGMGK